MSGIAVSALILVPLFLTAIVKYAPFFTARPKIASVSVVPPHMYGPKEFDYMQDDVPKRLREALMGVPGVEIRPSPGPLDSAAGEDVAKIAADLNADALIMPTVTIDSGLIQLNLQIVDAKTKRILYATPFQTSKDNYPDMMRAAGAALKRELQR